MNIKNSKLLFLLMITNNEKINSLNIAKVITGISVVGLAGICYRYRNKIKNLLERKKNLVEKDSKKIDNEKKIQNNNNNNNKNSTILKTSVNEPNKNDFTNKNTNSKFPKPLVEEPNKNDFTNKNTNSKFPKPLVEEPNRNDFTDKNTSYIIPKTSVNGPNRNVFKDNNKTNTKFPEPVVEEPKKNVFTNLKINPKLIILGPEVKELEEKFAKILKIHLISDDLKEFKEIKKNLEQLKKDIPNTEKYFQLIEKIDKEIQACLFFINITKNELHERFKKTSELYESYTKNIITKNQKNIQDIIKNYEQELNSLLDLSFNEILDRKIYNCFKKNCIRRFISQFEEFISQFEEDILEREKELKQKGKVESEKDNLTTETQELIKNKFGINNQKILNEFYEICKENEFSKLNDDLLDEIKSFSKEQLSLFFTKLNFFNSTKKKYKNILNKNKLSFQQQILKSLSQNSLNLLNFQDILTIKIRLDSRRYY